MDNWKKIAICKPTKTLESYELKDWPNIGFSRETAKSHLVTWEEEQRSTAQKRQFVKRTTIISELHTPGL